MSDWPLQNIEKYLRGQEGNISDDCRVVSHYTGIDAAVSILYQNSVRLSHCDYLNDPYEGGLLWGAVYDEIKSRFPGLEPTPNPESFLFHLRREKKKLIENKDSALRYSFLLMGVLEKIYNEPSWRRTEFFIISFSRGDSDNLPMWVQYSDRCTGVKLELNVSGLEDFFEEQVNQNIDRLGIARESISFDARFFKVIYKNREEFGGLAKKIVDIICRDFEEKCSLNELTLEMVFHFFNFKLRYYSIVYKLDDFKYEEEIRFVSTFYFINPINDLLRFRIRGGKLIPYMDMRLPSNCINRVVLGPCSSTEQAFREFLKKSKGVLNERHEFCLETSSIKFRN